MLIPEAEQPTGCKIWVPPDVHWTMQPIIDPPNGITMSNSAGRFDPAAGVVDGIGGGDVNYLGQGMSVDSNTLTMATVNLPKALQLNGYINSGAQQLLSKLPGEYQFYSLALAMVTDIAQQTCLANAAETQIAYSVFGGSNLLAPTTGVPRNAQMSLSYSVLRPDMKFGSTGLLMLGYYAWDYNGYKGPLRYLNSTSAWAVPDLPNPTGLYVVLKPGVSGFVDLGVNEYQQTAMIGTLGTINLLANQLTGLLPAPNL